MRLIKSLYWILFIENEVFKVFEDFHGIDLSDHPIPKNNLPELHDKLSSVN